MRSAYAVGGIVTRMLRASIASVSTTRIRVFIVCPPFGSAGPLPNAILPLVYAIVACASSDSRANLASVERCRQGLQATGR